MGSIYECNLHRMILWFETYVLAPDLFLFVLAQYPIPLHGCLRDVDHPSCLLCIEEKKIDVVQKS